jgi:RNA polymerase sigma-70 factor (ECF subfamily)
MRVPGATGTPMERMLHRYAGRRQGSLTCRTRLDEDRWPGELARAIERGRDGDPAALLYLYLRFAGNVHGYARSLVHDSHEAEDITQQVFAKLMTSLRGYEPRSVPFSAWLLRITRNLALDHLRKRRALPCEEVRGEEGDDGRHTAQLSLALREALAAMSDEQREVVVLRHIAGYSPGEIASRMDRSHSSVEGLNHRGRLALRRELERRGAAPVVAAAA